MDVPRLLLAACVVAGLVGASVLPVARGAGRQELSRHLSAYGAAMVALSGVAGGLDHRPGLVALGICIEFLQPLVSPRHWQDMAANAVG